MKKGFYYLGEFPAPCLWKPHLDVQGGPSSLFRVSQRGGGCWGPGWMFLSSRRLRQPGRPSELAPKGWSQCLTGLFGVYSSCLSLLLTQPLFFCTVAELLAARHKGAFKELPRGSLSKGKAPFVSFPLPHGAKQPHVPGFCSSLGAEQPGSSQLCLIVPFSIKSLHASSWFHPNLAQTEVSVPIIKGCALWIYLFLFFFTPTALSL